MNNPGQYLQDVLNLLKVDNLSPTQVKSLRSVAEIFDRDELMKKSSCCGNMVGLAHHLVRYIDFAKEVKPILQNIARMKAEVAKRKAENVTEEEISEYCDSALEKA